MRFLADAMLERLARWLRALGVDVLSAPAGASDAMLVRMAVEESRVLLTRDRGEVIGRGPTFVVRGAAPLEQLREVVERFAIVAPGELFTRCLLDNTPLRAATPDEAAGARAAGASGEGAVRRCPTCGRVYWEGSHTGRMRAALGHVLPGASPPEPEEPEAPADP